ncbi:hypothetical protein LS684_07095 [Cytobacillus spongiae]|jgi:hypothetical protein|uniref:hypothetical protein n=1 Tax=Cytobacillus spongiae TaxID=2901381 RepID=UPI001F2F2903|nr:hypothetical protein [Cytobacillus spongiae]UII57201.1 hypothetical protein LS684_07095 [Cytobacillus spongiae]
MRRDIERALRVKSLSLDILAELMEDGVTYDERELKHSVELLARSVNDLVNLYAGIEEDHPTTFKGTIAKMKIATNNLQSCKEKKRLENESV